MVSREWSIICNFCTEVFLPSSRPSRPGGDEVLKVFNETSMAIYREGARVREKTMKQSHYSWFS
jgi:hypothetical protein